MQQLQGEYLNAKSLKKGPVEPMIMNNKNKKHTTNDIAYVRVFAPDTASIRTISFPNAPQQRLRREERGGGCPCRSVVEGCCGMLLCQFVSKKFGVVPLTDKAH